MRFLTLLLLIVCCFTIHGQVRYVSVSGSGNHDGTSEANAWNLSEGLANDASGMLLYLKAGDYGLVNVTTLAAGSHWNGYNMVPGDLDLATGQASSYVYPYVVSTSEIPTFTGSGVGSGTAITITQNDVTIENLQIVSYAFGINASGNNLVVKNVVGREFGTQTGTAAYDGYGMRFTGNGSAISASIILNACAEGISIQGDSNVLVDTTVRADGLPGSNLTDYYILISGGDDNTVRSCVVTRTGDVQNGRHGFVNKTFNAVDDSTGNLFEDCIANNLNAEANGVAVTDNTWRNIEINGVWNGSGDVEARLRIANGAHHNKFINFRFEDCYGAVSFADWDDGLDGIGNSAVEFGGGNDNYIINPIIIRGRFAIYFEEFEALTTADNNFIIQATIDGTLFLFGDYMDNSGTRLINSNIKDVPMFQGGTNPPINTNTVFENVNVINSFGISELTPFQESDITQTAPPFRDEPNEDYTLLNSFVNGQNASIIVPEAAFDFNGAARVNYTLGAYEFGTIELVNLKKQIASSSVIRNFD